MATELQYRENDLRNHEWRVQRKAELEEEERERKLQAERAERERQKWREQARIDRLLKSTTAFQQGGRRSNKPSALFSVTVSCNEAQYILIVKSVTQPALVAISPVG